ncbi:MAG: HEPN domain-containing protein [Ignavibacteriaceae bacterium]|jgi:HEPN domain-containing protein|nr:HEPN domain-containing protein [Ignavibacteriaceae bacterium]
MTKQEHIEYWLSTSKEDLESAFAIFNSGKYFWSLFVAQLTLEKLLKVFWVRDNDTNFPPKTHDLNKIAKETNLSFIDADKVFLAEVSAFNIEARYPDYKKKFSERCTQDFANKYLFEIKEFIECTLKKM